jgi:hypothetical protein
MEECNTRQQGLKSWSIKHLFDKRLELNSLSRKKSGKYWKASAFYLAESLGPRRYHFPVRFLC